MRLASLQDRDRARKTERLVYARSVSAPDETRRSDRARRAILDTALDLVAARGYAKVTMEGIAASAGVGKQTIYRWWPSKAAVVFDAILDANSTSDGVSVPDTGDLGADLRSLMRSTIAELADPATDRLQRAVTAEIQADLAVADDLVRRLLRPQLDAVAGRVRAGALAGQVDSSVDADVAVEMLFGPVLHRWLLRTAPLDDDFADVLVAQVLEGLRPRDV